MRKVVITCIGLLCCALLSKSFGQIIEARRLAANTLWANYGQDPANPSKMPNAIPRNAGASVDTKTIAPNVAALETALTDLVNNNGGVILFNNTIPATITLNNSINLRPPYPSRELERTVVIQGKNITFNGANKSSIFVLRGKVRLIIQDAVFSNANFKGQSQQNLKNIFRTGGGAIEVSQGGPRPASLRVRNCQFLNNSVEHFRGIGENQNGAAIRLNTGTTGEVFGCTFKNNRAVSGGAIGATSINKLTVINSIFDGNLSNGYESTVGYMNVVEGAAAIRVDRTLLPVEIYGSKFENNAANVKVSVIEVFIRPIPENSQNYPKGDALIIDDCVFRKNFYNNYAGVSNFKRVFFAGCIVFHSGGAKGSFQGAKMKLTNSVFDDNEVGQANIRMINDFEISNCIFANTNYTSYVDAPQQGALFLQKVFKSGSISNCTFYNNEPRAGARASDIMFWAGDVPDKVSLNRSIFYRTNTNTSITQVHRLLKGGNNNQFIPGVTMGNVAKVAVGVSNTSNPNIQPKNITNMCLGTNSLVQGMGGLPDCDGNTNPPNPGNGQVLANGTYYFTSASNNQRMMDNRSEDNVRMTDPANADNQKWIANHLGNDIYTFKNIGSNRFLEVPFARCASSNSQNVSTWTSASQSHMRWKVIKQGNQYELRPIHCQSKSLDRNFGTSTVNSNVHVYNTVGNTNQRWKVISTSNARITSNEIQVFDSKEIVGYPNPMHHQLNLKGVQAGDEVIVRDQLGQVVFHTILQASQDSLDLHNLKNGLYFISVSGKRVQRIIKK
ncbi:hypothetical protein BKI52_43725 [marine bacterium AO1-C]|nr:hypothetical protein BKI52_43725 [marine bacterium AO1-C]